LEYFENICKEAVKCRDCFSDDYLDVRESQVNLAQPRYIGPDYFQADFRVLILMINPGQGEDPITLDLLEQYSSGKKTLDAIFAHQSQAMEHWNRGKLKRFYFEKIGLIKEATAFANISWCATEGNTYPKRMLERCFGKFTKPLVNTLDPDLILLSGAATYPFDRFGNIKTIKILHYAHRKGEEEENNEAERVRKIIEDKKNKKINYPDKENQNEPNREIKPEIILHERKLEEDTMDKEYKNFKDLEKDFNGKTLRTRDFSRSKLTPEEAEIIKQSAQGIQLKEILSRHTLRDVTHQRGDPQTVITEYGCALGFSYPEGNKAGYLAITNKIMSSFYDQHCHDEQIIRNKNDLRIQECLPSIFSIANYFMVVWVADFTLEGIGKLYPELRSITKDYKFD